MEEKLWRIGELAKATGLTVRTLHHYDEIGLLVPNERTYAGHRLYGEDDVRRLYEIRALRDLGVPLNEVPAALEGDLRATLEGHLQRVERDIERAHRLRSLLRRIVDAAGEASADDYMEAIQTMTMSEKYYTPEQLEQLDKRREHLGEERLREYEREWQELIAAAGVEKDNGTDPADPRMQQIAARWRELIEEFTGGDDGILNSLKTMYQQEGPERASRGSIQPELMQYVGEALRRLG